MMSQSGKITGTRLRLVLTLIAFLYCKEIAVSQERIGTVAGVCLMLGDLLPAKR
jgi:hypothetical protein